MAVHVSSALWQGGVDQERQSLLSLYQRALNRSWRGRFWSSLLGRSRRLFDLKEIEARCLVRSRSYAGLRVVPIDDIRGSEGRTSDFDRDFYPLQSRTQERWLGVAAARRRGKTLPPVALIQVGNLYFVQDGHHRISVARALGQKNIEARVNVWQVEGPFGTVAHASG